MANEKYQDEHEDQNIAKTFIVCGAVLEKEGKYFLVQESKKKVYGLWNLPAGKVDLGESLEEAAVREAFEETGYKVELIEEIEIFHGKVDDPVKHAYAARIVGGEYKKADDQLDAKWFTFKEIEEMEKEGKLRGGWIYPAIKKLREEN